MRKLKRGILFVAGLGALTLLNGPSHSRETYYDIQVRERQVAYQEENKANPVRLNSPVLPSFPYDRAEYIRRLERMESDFDKYLSGFLEYIKNNERGFIQLTNGDIERGGSIDLDNHMFVLNEKSHSWRTSLLKHLDAFRNGDYGVASILRTYLIMFGGRLIEPEYIRSVDASIDFLETLDKYNRMSPEEFDKLEYLEIPDPDGKKYKLEIRRLYDPKTQEFLKQYVDASEKMLEATKEAVKGSFPSEIPSRDGIYSGWHIHPFGTEGPSPADIGNTFVAGPEVVFVQHGNTLHVYGVNRGQVREIYALPVN